MLLSLSPPHTGLLYVIYFFSSFLSLYESTPTRRRVCAPAADNGETFSTRWLVEAKWQPHSGGSCGEPAWQQKGRRSRRALTSPTVGMALAGGLSTRAHTEQRHGGPLLVPPSLSSPFPSSLAHGPPSLPPLRRPARRKSECSPGALSGEALLDLGRPFGNTFGYLGLHDRVRMNSTPQLGFGSGKDFIRRAEKGEGRDFFVYRRLLLTLTQFWLQ